MRELKYNPKAYTISAMIIGYLIIGDYSAYDQNALGNWFMTIGQILEANSAIQQAIEEKFIGYPYNTNSKQYKNGGSPYMNSPPIMDVDSPEIKELKKKIDDLINSIYNYK